MIYQFPHERAYLPRTRLSYVNLSGILSDSKRERAARLSGYIATQLNERCYLIFLRYGEPFHAAMLERTSRGPIALAEVLRTIAAESERGETGYIEYCGACIDQLRTMLSTLIGAPIVWEEPLDPTRPDYFFPRLRERGFSGILELYQQDGAFHYLTFESGIFQSGYFAGRDEAMPIPEFLRLLFSSGAELRGELYPAFDVLPEQANPGLVELYRRILQNVADELAAVCGHDAALALLRRTQTSAAPAVPVIYAFDFDDTGTARGEPVAAPAALTEGVAGWVTEALMAASDDHGIDPSDVLERAAYDHRFVLQEHGFFSRLPWAIAI